MKDYYEILEVSQDATAEEIHQAYRLLAIKWHPDRNKGPDAVRKMQEINEAYVVLKNKLSRELYDNIECSGENCMESDDNEQHYSSYEPTDRSSGNNTSSCYYGWIAAMIFIHLMRACSQ